MAGAPYPVPPGLTVFTGATQAQSTPVADVPVRWTVIAGGGVGDTVVLTNSSGFAQVPRWVLGADGRNTMAASVESPPGSGDSTRLAFSVSAFGPEQDFTEYRLVLIDGQPPYPPDPISNVIFGGLIELGDKGVAGYAENDIDLGQRYTISSFGAYNRDHSNVTFAALAGLDTARFPADSAVLVGDTLRMTFVKAFDVGLDPWPMTIRETYVRVSTATTNSSTDLRRRRHDGSSPVLPNSHTPNSRVARRGF